MNKRHYIWWGIAFLAAIIWLLSGLSSSLWFLAALSGMDSPERLLGYQGSIWRRYPEVAASIESSAGMPMTFIGDYSSAIYVKKGNEERIIGIPKIRQQFSLEKKLQAASWATDRKGFIVIARKVPGESAEMFSSSGLFSAAGTALKAIAQERLPIHPVLIFQTSGSGDDAMAVYAEKNGDTVHIVLRTRASYFTQSRHKRISKELSEINGSFLSIQRDVLQYISKDFSRSIEQKIAQDLGFQKTSPEILKNMLENSSVVLAMEDDGIAVGVFSTNTAPSALITQWMVAEQGNRHPVKKAFSLPDKTLAYEYIPGNVNPYFALNKEKNSCLPSEEYDEKLFLCGKDQAVVLAKNEQLGVRLLSFMESGKAVSRGILRGNALEKVGLSEKLHTFEYAGDEDVLDVWADLAPVKN